MKPQKFIFFLFIGLLFSVTGFSQNKEFEIRAVSPFTGIKVSSGIKLYLKQGDDNQVSVESDARYINNIITEIKGGILNVYYSERNFFRKPVNLQLNVYVTAVWLETIEMSSGADLYCQQQLKLDQLTIKCSSGSDAHIDVECRELALYASSGSDIKVKGSAIKLTASASSGSNINAKEFETVYAVLKASSGADIYSRVMGEIEAHASSGADITYYGNAIPKVIRQSGGGEVRKR